MTKADFYLEQQCNHSGFHSLRFPGMFGHSVCVCVCVHARMTTCAGTSTCVSKCVCVLYDAVGDVIGNREERVQIPCFSMLAAPRERSKSDTMSQFANRRVQWGRERLTLRGQLAWTNRAPICVSTGTRLDGEDGVLMEKSREEKWTRKVRNKAEAPYSKKQGGIRWVKEGSKKTNRVPGETNIAGALKGNQFSRSSKQHFCRITHALKSSRQFQDDCCKRKAAACNLRQIHKLRKGGLCRRKSELLWRRVFPRLPLR